jgi:hypothetical protein
MADPTTDWTIEALHAHIQDAIDLELWTIPLYFCAMSSIKDPTTDPGKTASALILSIAVQEMLHLELACNLALAFGLTPQFKPPVYSPAIGIPFHTPETAPPINGPYTVQLGPLDENAINLFLEVEMPKDKSADKGKGTTGPADTYDSIGEFYRALRHGVCELWTSYNQPGNYDLQKLVFAHPTSPPSPVKPEQYPYLDIRIKTLDDAKQAIDTIVDQGEGADTQGNIPPEYRPANEPDDTLSHYERFRTVKNMLPIEIYTDNKKLAEKEQCDLDNMFTTLLENLSKNFSTPGPKLPEATWDAMTPIAGLATAVWVAGACPKFCMGPPCPPPL